MDFSRKISYFLPFTYQHQAPELCSGAFSVILILRNQSVPAIAGCRRITGYIAVRICDPDARHLSPLNSRSPATMLPGPARGRLCSASELVVRGRVVLLTHNRDAKLAEIPTTAARIAQPGEAGRLARCGNICPLRPSMSQRQIFPSGSLPPEQSSGSAVSASLF